MDFETLPSVSFLIPTLNAASVLEPCFKAIADQDYPKDKIEIVVADGGSTDKTLILAKKYGAKIYPNPLKTGEAGKAVAFKKAKNELVALIDSDNYLSTKNWLRQMVAPFTDKEVIGSEPWAYTYRKKDGFIDRYCALMGMNDPLCYFLGNYDRQNVLTGRWTQLPLKQEDKGSWLKINLKPPMIPTIGANGTILLREPFLKSGLIGDYLFDIDILAQLAEKRPIKFAKVKIGIIHLYCGGNIKKFIRKQKRRVKDYLFYQKSGIRHYPWQSQNKLGLLKFILACITILPLIGHTLKGYFKKPDSAWFFHPLVCWITFGVYGWEKLKSLNKIKEMSRENWKQ
ncbi:glycosyltransferase family 2 protein [Candidatus Shapirobacteria bacterium]|nr:glycosyltransferase family 2 protein [Candidatus Shapirobacteria bacterium]